MIGRTISHYKVLEKLGEGGMGVVYKAEDTQLKRTVALKFLSPQSLGSKKEKSRFLHEAQAAAALDHSNICTVYEINEVEGQSFITMAYVDGPSLREEIESGPLDVNRAVSVAIQTAEGLKEAHEKGIIHRDIKSANIMLTSKGQARITDFGLAKLPGRTKLTKTGTAMGTIAYISPEQARGEEVDHRTDIWSLGVVLYELLTGQTPFKGDHEAAIAYLILNEDVTPPSDLTPEVPAELDSIVAKMLQKNPNDRYADAEELLSDLRKVQTGAAVEVALPMSRKAKHLTWGLSVVLVIAVVLLVGIKIQIGRQPPAIAAENKLAVMYFENMADPEDTERLGDIVTNLLITDLSESDYLHVVSSQRLYDILKLLGKEGVKVIDRDLASQVAGKANAKWMLLGSILQVEPQMVLTAQLVDVASGNAVASQKIRGEADEEIFSLVDELTVEVKKDLSLPGKALKEPDRPVAEVTTDSPEAYRHYLEGLDYQAKYYDAEAENSFRKAVELDSTFAMAYLKLALYVWEERDDAMAKAVAYSDRVSQKEKHYIRCQEAWLSEDHAAYVKELNELIERYPEEKTAFHKLGLYHLRRREYEKAIGYFNKAIEIDPLFKITYNQLAYAYDWIGDSDRSIWAINKYIAIAPDEANPYDTRGDLHAANGKIDRAIESYKKALEIKPDYYMSEAKLGHMYLFKKEYATADKLYNELLANAEKVWRSHARTCLAIVPLYQGQFDRALQLLDDGIAADRMEQEGWSRADKHYLKAIIYEEKNDLDSALKESKKCMESVIEQDPGGVFQWQDHYAYLLAKKGYVAEGEELLHAVKKKIQDESPKHDWAYGYYWFMAGKIEMAKGNLASAAIHFNKAKKTNPRFDERFSVPFLLSSIYLELGNVGEAVAELEPALLRCGEDRAKDTINAVKAYYLLGLAYDQSGWRKKAIEQYEEFLEIWKDADPGIAEVDDARQRLAGLKSES
jgi:tetratricopeptide (TPR) repeat protein/tRNA A-37 threonylcarbamoyl transferase component Bud32